MSNNIPPNNPFSLDQLSDYHSDAIVSLNKKNELIVHNGILPCLGYRIWAYFHPQEVKDLQAAVQGKIQEKFLGKHPLMRHFINIPKIITSTKGNWRIRKIQKIKTDIDEKTSELQEKTSELQEKISELQEKIKANLTPEEEKWITPLLLTFEKRLLHQMKAKKGNELQFLHYALVYALVLEKSYCELEKFLQEKEKLNFPSLSEKLEYLYYKEFPDDRPEKI